VPDPVIVVEGARELAQAMRTADRALQIEMALLNQGAAEIVVDEALPHVPVGPSGDLRRSLQARGTRASGRATANTPYAMAIHWGRKTGNVGRPPGNHRGANVIAGRPFLWNAAKEKQEEITESYGRGVMALLDTIIDRGAL
jgi:hypothetical protein